MERKSRRRSLLNRPRRAAIDLRAWPPAVVDSPGEDTPMYDPVSGEALEPEFAVSEEPGAIPTVPSDAPNVRRSLTPTPAPAVPRPAPPVLSIPVPSLERSQERVVDPGEPFVPIESMSVGHMRAPRTTPLLGPREKKFILAIVALATTWIVIGVVGLTLLWMWGV